MRGKVLGLTSEGGVLLGADDRRYTFAQADWRGATPPAVWDEVDFVAAEETATAVYPVPPASPPRPHQPEARDLGRPAAGLAAFAAGAGLLGLMPGLGLPFAAIGVVLGVIAAGRARDDADDTSLLLSRVGYIAGGVMLALTSLAIVGVGLLLGSLAWIAGLGF